MRYAVISDIHSNLEALKAVLDDTVGRDIDRYLCVGDIIGYAADPKECIKIVKSLNPEVVIAGNHEWGVAGLLDLEYFNEHAKDAIKWTRTVLSEGELGYLKSFPLLYEDEFFAIVHGTLDRPQDFQYIFDKEDAYPTSELMNAPVCFVAHSHVAGIFYFDRKGTGFEVESSVRIDYKKKYVINVGSVGQPRDGDPRSSYAVYDDEDHTVEIIRVDYDIKNAQKKIMDAGLPAILAARLSEGR